MDKALKDELINKYRHSIAERYNYEAIKDDKNLPARFTRETVDELRNFFLNSLYTEPREREKLDAAFKQLETYVAHPAKIWALLGNLTAAIFKFGLHFPAALKTGAVSLRTHTTARHFEDMLLNAAQERGYRPPLTQAQFTQCLADLPADKLNGFISELTDLFMAISNVELLQKTTDILRDVLKRMKERKDLYGPEDHDAIQLGIDILRKGNDLLSKYDDQMKQDIVTFVTYSETRFINSLQPKGKKKKTL